MKRYVNLFLAALLLLLSCSGCSLINRSRASGSRETTKTVKQTQRWEIPSSTGELPKTSSYETIHEVARIKRPYNVHD